MVRDTTPRRSRLAIDSLVLLLLASACASSSLPPRKPTPPPSGVSLGSFTIGPSGYPNQYPDFFVGPVKQFDPGALEPSLAPIRGTPPVTPEAVKEVQRKILPAEARPAPLPPPPVVPPPLATPVMNTTPIIAPDDEPATPSPSDPNPEPIPGAPPVVVGRGG